MGAEAVCSVNGFQAGGLVRAAGIDDHLLQAYPSEAQGGQLVQSSGIGENPFRAHPSDTEGT